MVGMGIFFACFIYLVVLDINVYGHRVLYELCLRERFCQGMCYGIMYMGAGFLCGVLVDWIALSFYLIIVRSNLGLVVVVSVCYTF